MSGLEASVKAGLLKSLSGNEIPADQLAAFNPKNVPIVGDRATLAANEAAAAAGAAKVPIVYGRNAPLPAGEISPAGPAAIPITRSPMTLLNAARTAATTPAGASVSAPIAQVAAAALPTPTAAETPVTTAGQVGTLGASSAVKGTRRRGRMETLLSDLGGYTERLGG